jgi:trans-2,3-dihydro-3-hydroxyanthranilate isomerase
VIDGDSVTLTGGKPELGAVVAADVALAGARLSEADLMGDPVRLCGMGISFAYLHVKPDAVPRAAADISAISALSAAIGLFVFSYADGVAHARMFAPDVAEDPATGSAALGLGVWLASCGKVAADGVSSYVVEQGIEMGRPSRLSCDVRCAGGLAVEGRVSGSVVPIGDGRLRHP